MTYISSLLTEDKKTVKVWLRNNDGDRIVKRYSAPYYFYIKDDDGSYKDLYDNPLTKLEYNEPIEFFTARKKYIEENIKLYESDIKPEYKVLSEHFYGSDIGSLNTTFFDIEVDYDKDRGFSSPSDPYAPISSIAIYHTHTEETIVLVVPPSTYSDYSENDLPDDIKNDAHVVICENEEELLKLFFYEIENSDIISGWNSAMFDVPYVYERANKILYKKAGNKLCFHSSKDPYYKDVEIYGNINKKLCLHGRVSLDYIDVYKKFEMDEKPSYKLEHVAEDELPHLPKISYEGSLYDLYHDNFEEFIRYNIRDTIILKELENKKKYIKLAIQMSHMATSQIEDVLGTIRIAENSIINYCHYDLNKQVPDTSPPESSEKYDGATVISPKVGMHEWVASLDLTSLYPSTMRSLNISPETLVGQFIDQKEAFKEIINESEREIKLVDEYTNKTISAPAKQWKRIIQKKNWTISAAGTLFHQQYDGVIPSILTTWFNERKKYKNKMKEAANNNDEVMLEYYDRMQYIKKIQLNAMYGATANTYFKFFDVRLAASTTLSGREVLYHMARKIAEQLDGYYNMESNCVVYGDSVSADTKITIYPNTEISIKTLFKETNEKHNGKEYYFPENLESQTYDIKNNKITFKPIKYIMRHKVSKKMYRVYITDNHFVDVTEDHSLMGYKGNSKLISKRKPTNLNNVKFVTSINNILGFIKPKDVKVEEIEYDDYVYDVEIEDTHTFFANNILVHNTDSVYFQTYENEKNLALQKANEICQEVNASYPSFMQETFNCDNNHKNLMKAEQEIVTDRGIFIKKKYYILHLVSDDGKEVDKMKNMGVPIKKTTLPKEIKEKLSSYIERLLKGESWDIIGPEIVDFKDELKNDITDIKKLGLPIGVKNLESYTNKFNNRNKDESVYLPGNVAASILWNKCLESYKDHESPRISSGSKIFVFYLTKKIDTFKSIAVPKDLEVLPEWFLEHFVPIIDKDAQIERLIDNPMRIMISAAGIKVPTKKKLKFEEGLFE